MKFHFIAVLSACFLHAAQIAVAAPAMEPVTYPLITNGNASGNLVGVTGGSYLLQLSGTFGGSTLGLNVTTNGVTTSYGTWTSTPASVPCFNIPTSSIVRATLTGGTPSNITATLGGVGSGGCATGASGGVGGSVAVADGDDVALGAKSDASCGTDSGTCSLIAIVKRLMAAITTLNGKIDTLNTNVTGAVPAGVADIGETSPTTRDLTSGVTTNMTGTTSTQLLPAAGSGKKNYLGTLVCYNINSSVDTGVDILDGNGGAVIGSIPAAKLYGGAVVRFSPLLPQPTANTAMHVVNRTTGAGVTCTGTGMKR